MAIQATNVSLPRDDDSNAVQVLRPVEDSTIQASIGATQQRIAFPAGTTIIELTVTADSRIKFGNSSVVADGTSRALLRGTYVYMTGRFDTHISVIQLTPQDSGFLTVTQLK